MKIFGNHNKDSAQRYHLLYESIFCLKHLLLVRCANTITCSGLGIISISEEINIGAF